jgi:hypothetical protein
LSSQLGLFLLPAQLGLFLGLRRLPEVCPVDRLMFLTREDSWLFLDWLSLGKCSRGQNCPLLYCICLKELQTKYIMEIFIFVR